MRRGHSTGLLLDISHQLGQQSSKLDTALEQWRSHSLAQAALEKRVDSLEATRDAAVGVAAEARDARARIASRVQRQQVFLGLFGLLTTGAGLYLTFGT